MNFENIPFQVKVLIYSLVFTLIFFNIIYTLVQGVIFNNSTIFYIVFTLTYTFIAWKIVQNEFNSSGGVSQSLAKSFKFYIMLLLILFNWDLLMFPFLVNQNGILPNLDAGGRISSDVFIHNLLPAGLPEIIKYNIIYCFIPSLSFFFVALLAEKKKTFNAITTRGF